MIRHGDRGAARSRHTRISSRVDSSLFSLSFLQKPSGNLLFCTPYRSWLTSPPFHGVSRPLRGTGACFAEREARSGMRTVGSADGERISRNGSPVARSEVPAPRIRGSFRGAGGSLGGTNDPKDPKGLQGPKGFPFPESFVLAVL